MHLGFHGNTLAYASWTKVGAVATPQLLSFCDMRTYPLLPQYVDHEFLMIQYFWSRSVP